MEDIMAHSEAVKGRKGKQSEFNKKGCGNAEITEEVQEHIQHNNEKK